MDDRRRMKRAFTMVELAIVLVLVVVVTTAVMPTIMRVFDLNASAQAFNIMASQLRSARASAVANDGYAAVHHQKADHTAPGQKALRDRFFVAVLHQEVETSLYTQIHISEGLAGGVTKHGTWEPSAAIDQTGQPQYDNGGQNNSATYVEFSLADLPHTSGVVEYNLYMRWGAPASGENVVVEIYHALDDYGKTFHAALISQTTVSREWDLLGQFPFNVNGDRIIVKTEGASGTVVLGGFLLAASNETQVFGMAPGQTVKQLPGSIAFGELKNPGPASNGTFNPVNNTFINGIYDDGGNPSALDENGDFTSFSVVFTANGMLTGIPGGDTVRISSALVADINDLRLWDEDFANAKDVSGNRNGEPGARLLAQFDYARFKQAGADGVDYLNRNAQLLPINIHTGDFILREE